MKEWEPPKPPAQLKAERDDTVIGRIVNHLKDRLSPSTIGREVEATFMAKMSQGSNEVGNMLFSGAGYLPWPGEGQSPQAAPEQAPYAPPEIEPVVQAPAEINMGGHAPADPGHTSLYVGMISNAGPAAIQAQGDVNMGGKQPAQKEHNSLYLSKDAPSVNPDEHLGGYRPPGKKDRGQGMER